VCSSSLVATELVIPPGVLTKEQFYGWVAMVFEDMPDAELEEICASLLQVTKVNSPPPNTLARNVLNVRNKTLALRPAGFVPEKPAKAHAKGAGGGPEPAARGGPGEGAPEFLQAVRAARDAHL